MDRLTYCFDYGVLKLYIHYNNNARLIYRHDLLSLTNAAGKKELYGSNTCYYS